MQVLQLNNANYRAATKRSCLFQNTVTKLAKNQPNIYSLILGYQVKTVNTSYSIDM